jgi:CIC family chloride channel protein
MKIWRTALPAQTAKWLSLYALSSLVGLAGGCGAVVFRMILAAVHRLFFQLLLPRISLELGGYNPVLLLLPALGGLIIGPITMRIAPETAGAGVPEVMEAVAQGKGRLKKRTAVLKILASAVTIGSGGSAGREGPIAQIGATIGSFLGSRFKLQHHDVRLLVVCGLAAGIAGTYNAPLGGALFGIEILLRGIDLIRAVPVVLSSVIGASVAALFLGKSSNFQAAGLSVWAPRDLIFYILLGVIFGFVSVLWVRFFYAVDRVFSRLKLRSNLKPALGGIITGILIFLLPGYGIAGVGYDGLNLALAGKIGFGLLILLAGMKMIATAATIGAGGSGGIFAPTLYIGGMLGAFTGMLLQWVFPTLIQQPVKYALAGMAALFAGATQAPLNIMIMIPEMTGDFGLLPPIMASSVCSFLVAWLFLRGDSIYTLKLKKRGIDLRMGKSFNLDFIKVEQIMNRKVIPAAFDAPLASLEALAARHDLAGYPVEKQGKLVGWVTLRDFVKTPADRRNRLNVGDIASPNFVVSHPEETLHAALEKMEENRIDLLPVVDRDQPQRILGVIGREDILSIVFPPPPSISCAI